VAPGALGEEDAAALIGVAAVLEGQLLARELDPDLVDSLIRHMAGAGLVAPGAGPAELRLALSGLNHRLRYVLGEYDEPPAPPTGEVDQYFGFSSRDPAQDFAGAARAMGESAASPVPVDGRAYDGEVGWQVAVRTMELPLSAGFADHVRRLQALAAEHGGSYGGWGG
jgi:hypothetical protein